MANQPQQQWLINYEGVQIDLFNAMVAASNADWRALTVQTGLGPFAVSKRMQAMQLMREIFPAQDEGESDEHYQVRMAEAADVPIGFNEGNFIQTISALVWLALRAQGKRDLTFDQVDQGISFWESMGMLQQVSEFRASQDGADEGDPKAPTTPANSDPGDGKPAEQTQDL